MLQNYNRYRILQEFFDYPKKDFLIRQLSRKVKLAQVSVINHLAALIKDGLVIKENKGIYPSFRANTENEDFRLLKQQNSVSGATRAAVKLRSTSTARLKAILLLNPKIKLPLK